MLSVVFASMSGINRLNKIAIFTEDGLVRSLLKLGKGINKNALSSGLKKLGEAGSRKLQTLLVSKNSRILKAIRTVKEYIETDFFGEWKIVPVYQYACYISTYELDAAGLHEIYKQRSTIETWIEQVKGQAMAGATLTDDFWANDILWQLFQKLRVEWSLLQLYQDEEIISEAN